MATPHKYLPNPSVLVVLVQKVEQLFDHLNSNLELAGYDVAFVETLVPHPVVEANFPLHPVSLQAADTELAGG